MNFSLTYLAGLVIICFLSLLALTLLVWIWIGRIPLYKLISEPNGDASMSRLQLLIFTFVIAFCFLMITVGKSPPAFPNPIPAEVLTLLGISASSYLVSKGIQFSSPAGLQQAELAVVPATYGPPAAGAALPSKLFTAIFPNTGGATAPPVKWSLDSPALGNLTPGEGNTVTYAPGTGVTPGQKITIRAKAPGYADGTGEITY